MIKERSRKYDGYFKIDQLNVEKRSGDVVPLELMCKRDAVASIVYDTEKEKYIFVRQWRPGCQSNILEIAAGTCDVAGESLEDAMKREIDEELGYEVDHMEMIGEYYMSPGCMTEKIAIFYSEVSNKLHDGGGLENEDIDIVELDIEEVMNVDSIKDAKTMIAVAYVLMGELQQ